MQIEWPASRAPNSLEVESVTKRRRTDEGQPVQRGADNWDLAGGRGGREDAQVCRRHGISDATFYIYGRLPRGKKVLGPGLAVIDCKHLFGVTT